MIASLIHRLFFGPAMPSMKSSGDPFSTHVKFQKAVSYPYNSPFCHARSHGWGLVGGYRLWIVRGIDAVVRAGLLIAKPCGCYTRPATLSHRPIQSSCSFGQLRDHSVVLPSIFGPQRTPQYWYIASILIHWTGRHTSRPACCRPRDCTIGATYPIRLRGTSTPTTVPGAGPNTTWLNSRRFSFNRRMALATTTTFAPANVQSIRWSNNLLRI